MYELNLRFAWLWILIGLLSVTAIGIFFHDPDWLGGYSSWRRRMVRLCHISFLGTGLLNLGFAFTIASRPTHTLVPAASWLFVAGAVTMPAVCFLSAWKDQMRHLFVIPVATLIGATIIVVLIGW